ncbi:hypothetical protein EII20_10355, partial [Comamonadaceae bacterium OH2545_COT-014]
MKVTARKILLPLTLFSASHAVQAQNVLMLSTNEQLGTSPQLLQQIQQAYEGAGAKVTHQRGTLSEFLSIDSASFAGQDVVVVAASLDKITDQKVDSLKQALMKRPHDGLAFVFLVDGCCDGSTRNTQNVERLVDQVLKPLTGWNLAADAKQYQSTGSTLPLNTQSAYQGFFSNPALAPHLRGEDYRPVSGVPAENAVYLRHDLGAMPAPGSTTSAYSLFVPQASANNGAGACVLFTGDTTHFGPSDAAPFPAQRLEFAKATLALRNSAHCKTAQTITFPPQPAQTFAPAPGNTFTLTGVKGGPSSQPVTFTSQTPAVCAVNNSGSVTMLAAGTCTVQANQDGGNGHTAAPAVTQDISIQRAAQTITVPAQAPVPPFAANATYALNGVTGGASGQPLQYASTTPGVCTVDANTGVVTMLATGNC